MPQRLGDMDVTVHAETLIGKDQITRKLHVEVSVLIRKVKDKNVHCGKRSLQVNRKVIGGGEFYKQRRKL